MDQSRWIPVEKMARMQFSFLRQKEGVSLDCDVPGLEIDADPLVERVFYTLFENAIIHGRTFTRISISGLETPAGLVLACEDDGTGILAEEKTRIFDRVVGGGGKFGLLFARESLTLSGMEITETGARGRGARF